MSNNPVRLQSGDGIHITQTSNALDVNIKSGSSGLPTGAALASKQDTQITAEQAIQAATEALAALISAGKLQVDAGISGGTISVAPVRAAGVLHRSAIATADKCVVPTLATKSQSDTGGSLPASTTYYVSAAAGNLFGTAGACNVLTQATGANAAATHSVLLTVPQVVGATYYDIFFSVDAAPKWIGRITEAQRAAGDYQIQTYATVTSGGGNAAGTVLIGTVGTGIQTTNAVYAANNAYITPTPTATIDCNGKSYVDVWIEMTLTDLRSAPSLSLMPIFESGQTPADYFCGSPINVPVMNGSVGQGLKQMYRVDVEDMAELIIAVGTISGQGASVDIWAEAI